MEKKCALIYNRNSSGFKQRNFLEILRTIRKMGIMPIPIDSHHPNFIIENLPSLNEKFDYVLTMGGDGTVNKAYEAYNQLEDEQNAIYGHIPMGTTNDMGPNTNVPRYNPKKATSLLLSGQIEERDIITLNNRAIAYVGAMGILAPVTYLIDKSGDKKDAGTFSYIRYGAKEFFTNPELYKNIVRDPFQITYEANGNSVSTSAIFIAIFACITICDVIKSSASGSIPPVSINVKSLPLQFASAYTLSLVTPGVSSTMEILFPTT